MDVLPEMAEVEEALRAVLAEQDSGQSTMIPKDPCSLAGRILGGDWAGVLRETTSTRGDGRRCLETCFGGVPLDALVESLPMQEHLRLFAAGVAALQLFVGANWAGWDLDKDPVSLPLLEEEVKTEHLILDGEELCEVASNVELLYLARALLRNNRANVYATNWVIRFNIFVVGFS